MTNLRHDYPDIDPLPRSRPRSWVTRILDIAGDDVGDHLVFATTIVIGLVLIVAVALGMIQ